jgi:hypothetical protein
MTLDDGMTRRINIVKMPILPKTIYRFNATPINIQMASFTEKEKIIVKFIGMYKIPLNSQSNPEKKLSDFVGITIPVSNYTTEP